MFFGSRLNRLATSIRRGISKYSVGSDNPGLVFDFIDNFYQKDKNQTVNFDGAITHSRSGNAVMTDGYGPELVVNGGFDSDVSGWTNHRDAVLTVTDGKLNIAISTNTYSGIIQEITLKSGGGTYDLELDYTKINSFARIAIGTTNGGNELADTSSILSSGKQSVRFTTTTETVYVKIYVNSATAGDSITIDNVSVREMPVLKWAPHNLLSYSEEFDQWGLGSSSTLTANYASAPNGEQTAYRVQFPTSAGTFINANMSGKQQGGSYTFAVFVKATSGTSDFGLYSDIAGSQTTSATLTATSEWQLFEFTAIAGASGVTWGINNGNDSYASDILIWGAHVYRSDLGGMVDNPDQPLSRASYVPTTSSAKWLPRVGHHVYNGSAWVNEGLLAESESRVNLALQSDFSNGTLTGLSRTANDAISPDGTQNAFKIQATSTSASIALTGILTNAESYAVSIYAKAGNHDIIRIMNGSSGASAQWFDLTNGALLSSNGANNTATIQDVGNGWYRCTRYFDSVTAPATNEVFVGISNGDGATSGTVGDNVYLYGLQIENNATSSSFIPTSGSSVTRAAESFTIPSANLPWPEPNYIGSELVTNGTFDTDVSSWSTRDTGAITYDSGALKLERTGTGTVAGIALAYQTVSGLTVGNVYEASATILFDSADGTSSSNYAELAIDQSGNNESTSSTRGVLGFDVAETISVIFVATATSQEIGLSLRGNATGFVNYDNVSVREIDPLSVSIAMDGRMTYADENNSNQARLVRHFLDSSNSVEINLNTASTTGVAQFIQEASNVVDFVTHTDEYAAGILSPFNIASRHGSTFINGATDGVALTANTTPTALPDLSATDLSLAYDYMGTLKTFRVWDRDLGDDGLVEATNPSLEPSLSLTFEGTGTNSFVVNNWSE